jgi:TPR repeat protein
MGRLAELLDAGAGGERPDFATAARWWLRAAEAGERTAVAVVHSASFQRRLEGARLDELMRRALAVPPELVPPERG